MVPFWTAFRACAVQQSLVSSYTPNTYTSTISCFLVPPKQALASRLNFIRLRVRQISLYLASANFIICRLAQQRHYACTPSRVLQLASIEVLYISIFVLSANPIADTLAFRQSQISSSSEAYRINSISNSIDPQGTLYQIPNRSDSQPCITKVVIQSIRKAFTYQIS